MGIFVKLQVRNIEIVKAEYGTLIVARACTPCHQLRRFMRVENAYQLRKELWQRYPATQVAEEVLRRTLHPL